MSEVFSGKAVAADLIDLLRLKTTPIGIKMYEKKEEIDKIPKLRRPERNNTICQILAQASQNGFTIACTAEDIDTDNCRCISGLQDPTTSERFMKAAWMKGGWFETLNDCANHQASLTVADKKYEALVTSPLRADRIVPDVCIIAATPGQAFTLLAAHTRSNYKALDLRFVSESSCSEGWVRTLKTGKPGFVPPCYAELRFANYSDGEMIVSFTPDGLMQAINGLKALSAMGLRYPVPGYGITFDPREGANKTYKE